MVSSDSGNDATVLDAAKYAKVKVEYTEDSHSLVTIEIEKDDLLLFTN